MTGSILRPKSPMGCPEPQKPLCSPSEPMLAMGEESVASRGGGAFPLLCCAQASESGMSGWRVHTSPRHADIQPSFHPPLQPTLTHLFNPGLTHPSPSAKSSKDKAGSWTGCPSPGPAPTAVGTHTATGGEAASSRQREKQGQEAWREGRTG